MAIVGKVKTRGRMKPSPAIGIGELRGGSRRGKCDGGTWGYRRGDRIADELPALAFRAAFSYDFFL